MTRARSILSASLVFAAVSSLTACNTLTRSVDAPVAQIAGMQGYVHGGQQPVSLASVQLYAVGTTGDGSAPTPLLATPVPSDINGDFTISHLYTCPSASTLVYLVSTGGNPGLTPGTNNPALTLVSALGACGSLATTGLVNIDEVTTVAAAAALAPFITAPTSIGSATTDALSLQQAFALAVQLANPNSGTAPGVGQNLDAGMPTIPTTEIDTLANVLSTCANSTGSTAPGTPCTSLFGLTGSPSDIFSAAVNLEKNPTLYNSTSVYNLVSTNGPFQPALPAAPSTFAITATQPTIYPGTFGTIPSYGYVGSYVNILKSAVTGTCTFAPPISVTFAGNYANGSFDATVVKGIIPSGVPLGLVSGTIVSSSGTCNFAVYVKAGSSYSLSSGSNSYGNQVVLTQSAATPFTLTNNQTVSVAVNSVGEDGTQASSFPIISDGCTSTILAPGASCTVSVAFRPVATGPASTDLIFYVNGAAISYSPFLSGTGL